MRSRRSFPDLAQQIARLERNIAALGGVRAVRKLTEKHWAARVRRAREEHRRLRHRLPRRRRPPWRATEEAMAAILNEDVTLNALYHRAPEQAVRALWARFVQQGVIANA